MVGRVDTARDVIDKEWLIWVDRVDSLHLLDRVIRLSRNQIPLGIADVGVDRAGIAEQVGLPLISIAADKAVEVIEAFSRLMMLL
jgi:hypothetical protein